ncbi:MAG: HypC/HybG/HupF family hydrogenase formation chaperone [bacterium]
MCLGVPGRIIEKYENEGLLMGRVDFGGAVREVCLAYTPEAAVGEYALIHAGFAISLIEEQEARETLELLEELELGE